jgi:hypothetical protein
MPGLQASRKPARGFGNNLKASGNGIDRARIRNESLVVEARDEMLGQLDVMQDVAKGGERGFRRHRPRQRMRLDEYTASGRRGSPHRPAIKQTGDVLLEARIIENGDVCSGIDLDHDVGVAVGAVIAAHTRTEKCGTSDTARPQGGFVFPKLRKDLLSVHFFVTPKAARRTLKNTVQGRWSRRPAYTPLAQHSKRDTLPPATL